MMHSLKNKIFMFFLLLSVSICGAYAQASTAFDKNGGAVKINADRLTLNENNDTAIFEGKVTALQEGSQLNAQKLAVEYGVTTNPATGKEERAAKVMIATGSVILTLPDQVITGDVGRYDLIPELMTIRGNVVVQRKGLTLTGHQLLADMRTGITRVFSKDGKPVGVNLDQ